VDNFYLNKYGLNDDKNEIGEEKTSVAKY